MPTPRAERTGRDVDSATVEVFASGSAIAGDAVVTTEVMASHGSVKPVATRPPTPEWENFAPTAPPVPGRLARITAVLRRPGRFATHEWTVVVLAGLLLSALGQRSLLLHPGRVLPVDHGESATLAWLLGHGPTVLAHLGRLDGLLPAPAALAHPDALLGFLPLALIGNAVLRYAIGITVAGALGFVGAYALARQLGTGRAGAAVAGVAVTLAPWHLAAGGGAPVLGTAGLALTLAMLARGHGVRLGATAGPVRTGWVIAGWGAALWQAGTSVGATILLAYVLLAAAVVAVVRLATGRRVPPRRLLLVDGIGALAVATALIVLAHPYPPTGDPTAVTPVRGLLLAPAGTFLWGGAHAYARSQLADPATMALLPGYALAALALAGVFVSTWAWWVRLALVAGAAVGVLLVLGGSPYAFVVDHLPGLRLLPTPAGLVVHPTLVLALLAAGGVAGLVQRAQEAAGRHGLPEPPGPARLALLVPVLLLLLEGAGTPVAAAVVTPRPAQLSAERPATVTPS